MGFLHRHGSLRETIVKRNDIKENGRGFQNVGIGAAGKSRFTAPLKY